MTDGRLRSVFLILYKLHSAIFYVGNIISFIGILRFVPSETLLSLVLSVLYWEMSEQVIFSSGAVWYLSMTGTLLKSEICPCNWKNNNICQKCRKKGDGFLRGNCVCVREREVRLSVYVYWALVSYSRPAFNHVYSPFWQISSSWQKDVRLFLIPLKLLYACWQQEDTKAWKGTKDFVFHVMIIACGDVKRKQYRW